ncbi:hypothetical protein SAMN04488505_102776 [Chitinophaga rupis]|uniref:Uncharacterized protein n=1 Tax=Chitinophaga rupis TaxID=573321 RepID=A0A1H7RZB9_9BACT|nr:hypothetical protein [Chitinophaga rupis]SEL65630.1 hypothetical protein SAMN04488505_102776 [Chitinophaga rupis]
MQQINTLCWQLSLALGITAHNISVAFTLKEASYTTLGILDMSGKLVAPQLSGRLQPGQYNKTDHG